MTVESPPDQHAQWLSLGAACRLLNANQATLRQWADNGYLRVYRTPGGHRRFLASDILALTNGTSLNPDADRADAAVRADAMEGSALRRIRRRLSGEAVARQAWYQSVEEEGRVRMRLFGRRLLSLLVQDPAMRRRRQEAMSESHMLGGEYGTEMADRGVSLKDTLEAFVFFRSMVLDSADPQAWPRILELADQVMVGLAESYQKRME